MRVKRAMMHSKPCHSHRIAVNYIGLQGKHKGSNTSACEATDSKQASTRRGEASHDGQQVFPITQECIELHRMARKTIGKQYISMQSNRQQASSNQEGIKKETRAKRAIMHIKPCHSHRIAMHYIRLQGKQSGSNTSACNAPDSKQAQTRRGLNKNACEASNDAQQALQFTQDCNELHRIAGETIRKQSISMQL